MDKDIAEQMAELSAKAFVDLIDNEYCLALTRWCQSQDKHPIPAAVNLIKTAGVFVGADDMPEAIRETMIELLIATLKHSAEQAEKSIKNKRS